MKNWKPIIDRYFAEQGRKEKMKKLTLANSFHRTEITILVDSDSNLTDHPWGNLSHQQGELVRIEQLAEDGDRSARQKLGRIRRTLCGIADCHCGLVR